MGLNVSKGNMYPWINFTWNTVKGECPHGCKYCYMHKWGKLPPPHFDEKEFREFDKDMIKYGEGQFIFVGSSCDMFADDIPGEWIFKTLEHCKKFDNTYLFQSKNPKNFNDVGLVQLNKIILCITLETNRVYPEIMRNAPDPVKRAIDFSHIPIEEKYITIEPIMDFDLESLVSMIRVNKPTQVNIGADSGNNDLPEPSQDKIEELFEELNVFTKVKLKANLNRLIK